MQALDFRKHASKVIEAIRRDTQPVLVSNMYTFRSSPIVDQVLQSGEELKNGNWLDLLPAQADRLLALNHPDPKSVYRALFPKEQRKKHRLWRQFAGCVTNLHFDPGWSSLLNTQVQGRKKWMLIGPTASLQMQSMGATVRHALSIETQPLKADEVFTLVTQPGETLFVPRFWYHHVWTLEDSLNLVRTIPMGCKAMPFLPSFRQILGAMFGSPDRELAAMLLPHLPVPSQTRRALDALFAAPHTVEISDDIVSVTLSPLGTKRELTALAAVLRECNRLSARRVKRGGWKFPGDRVPPAVRSHFRLQSANA